VRALLFCALVAGACLAIARENGGDVARVFKALAGAWMAVGLAFAMVGCATPITVDTDPVKFFAATHKLDPAPADWPKLRIEVEYLPADQIGIICGGLTIARPIAGCAYAYFVRGVCVIHINHSMRSNWIVATLAEEIKHCNGQDHAGQTTLLDAWQRYKTLMLVIGDLK